MHILIVGNKFSFPEGHAATNRVIAYAKGMISHGARVEVIGLGNEYKKYYGKFEGISYYFPLRREKRSSNYIIRNICKINKYLNYIFLFKWLNQKSRVDAILIYSDSLFLAVLQYVLCRRTGSLLIKEYNEIILKDLKSTFLNKIWLRIYGVILFRLFDGFIVISNYLRDYVWQRGCGKNRVLIVPAITDISRFRGDDYQSPISSPYILQGGTLNMGRDAIDILLYAFKKVIGTYPDIRLVLTGRFYPDPKDKFRIIKLTKELGLGQFVIIKEDIPSKKVPMYFKNARILVLTRRGDIEETRASFPTKLPEYLAAGRPVIASMVGDIPIYLMDGINAYLVPYNNIEAIAEKIKHVLKHKEEAEIVGKEGQKIAASLLNGEVQAPRIIKFIEELEKFIGKRTVCSS